MQTETLSMSKVCFITGSWRGLGRALTEVVLESGHLVVATARKPELLADLTKTYGDRVRAVKLDVTSPADEQKVLAAAKEAFAASMWSAITPATVSSAHSKTRRPRN